MEKSVSPKTVDQRLAAKTRVPKIANQNQANKRVNSLTKILIRITNSHHNISLLNNRLINAIAIKNSIKQLSSTGKQLKLRLST